MSASSYQQLLTHVFTPADAALQDQLFPLYQDLETALKEARPGRQSQENVSFRFERLRLGLGITLMQLLTDLGGDEDSALVRDLLEEALAATSVEQIDKVIQKKSHLFEELYTELYVNADAEQVLALFETTLHATTQQETDQVITQTLQLAQDLEFHADASDEEDSPEA
ncbi:hypothetical protein [Rufibacter sp. LB8]|uniref:hypothetical protein n=1 Tax=Rufibacter sp. LB8 TaxID=2777781 RepID=UPI00178C6585|nr:hypothetical protein [Rufibacter sp. LB8]